MTVSYQLWVKGADASAAMELANADERAIRLAVVSRWPEVVSLPSVMMPEDGTVKRVLWLWPDRAAYEADMKEFTASGHLGTFQHCCGLVDAVGAGLEQCFSPDLWLNQELAAAVAEFFKEQGGGHVN